MFTSDLNAGVVPQMSPPPHDLERLRTTMVDFIVVSIQLVFMVLGVSYSRVLAQRPTGCCSASLCNISNITYTTPNILHNSVPFVLENKTCSGVLRGHVSLLKGIGFDTVVCLLFFSVNPPTANMRPFLVLFKSHPYC